MKLELKHLAPYLPYKMRFVIDMYEFTEGNCKPEIRHFTMGNDLSMCLNYGKPILRPLSDLLKDVKVDNDVINFQKHFNEYEFEWLITSNNKRKLINSLDYFIVSKMIEYHFDIFGLINEGLAIDINTLSE